MSALSAQQQSAGRQAGQGSAGHGFMGRAPLWRRIGPAALILLLHLGLLVLVRDALLHQDRYVAPFQVVTAMLFPAQPLPVVPPPRRTTTPVHRTAPPKPVVVPRAAVPPPTLPTPSPRAIDNPPPQAAEATPAAPAAAPVAEPAPPPAPAPPKTVTSGVQYLSPPQPEYPAQSKRMGEEGKVVLRVLIDEKGHPERIDIQKSSGFPRLDDAARDAVRQARFKPHMEEGQAKTVYAIVPISFRLDQ